MEEAPAGVAARRAAGGGLRDISISIRGAYADAQQTATAV